jgi:hypothetical protein
MPSSGLQNKYFCLGRRYLGIINIYIRVRDMERGEVIRRTIELQTFGKLINWYNIPRGGCALSGSGWVRLNSSNFDKVNIDTPRVFVQRVFVMS